MKTLIKKIFEVGDVMFDSVKFYKKKLKKIKTDDYATFNTSSSRKC